MQNMYCKYIKKKSASVIVAETQRRVKKITEPFFPLQADICLVLFRMLWRVDFHQRL